MKELTQPIDELAEKLYGGTQKFYRHTLDGLITYKVWLGREIIKSPLYKQYGENLIEQLSDKTGLNHTVLYDAVNMYSREKLTEAKEKAFIKEFAEKFSSWNDYKRKALKSPSVESSESRVCVHVFVCSKCGKSR